MAPDMVFLDRDGTLNRKAPDGEYIEKPDQVELIVGAAAAVRRLNGAGVPVVVVTNQRGVALGRMSAEEVEQVNAALAESLRREGAVIDAWLVCPHAANACECRKPGPGLLRLGLTARPSVRAERCVVVGDAESDVLAGRALGMPGVLLAVSAPEQTVAAAVCPDLSVAVDWMLGPVEASAGP